MPDTRAARSYATDLLSDAAHKTRAHPRVALAAVGSLLAGGVALMLGRGAKEVPPLPDAVELAGTTAASVHNAARGSVSAAVGAVDHPSEETVLEAVRLGVTEAATAGADITAAALGGVAGAVDASDLLGVDALSLARRAAEAARLAAGGVGPAAAVRVRDALEVLRED